MEVQVETLAVVTLADGTDTSYRAALLPGRRHKAANKAALHGLTEAARVLGGHITYTCADEDPEEMRKQEN